MIRFLFLLLALWGVHAMSAQTAKRIYLFDKYTKGIVLMRNRAIVPATLNYDAANSNMMYIDGQNEMILTDIQRVDTVFIGEDKFIPAGQEGFLELRSLKNGIVFINWKLEKQFLGKKGAYGQVIQGTVESVNINAFKQQAGYEGRDANVTDVYTQMNHNEYWLQRNGKFVKCKNEKSLLKLFPKQEELIKAYIKEQKVDFNNPRNVIDLLDYCLGISK